MDEIQKTETGLTEDEMLAFFGEPDEDNISTSFGAIKVMRESAQFELPSGDLVAEISGHVLYSHNANAYWANSSDDSETTPPDCGSNDGIKPDHGDNQQSKICATCPMNQFESAAVGKGKACKNTIKMLMLLDGEYIPVILAAPPTSISRKGSLMKWMNVTTNQVGKAYTEFNPKIRTSKGAPVTDRYLAHVKFSLSKETYSGKSVSVIQAETVDVLLPDTEGVSTFKYINTIKGDAVNAYKAETMRNAVPVEEAPIGEVPF